MAGQDIAFHAVVIIDLSGDCNEEDSRTEESAAGGTEGAGRGLGRTGAPPHRGSASQNCTLHCSVHYKLRLEENCGQAVERRQAAVQR